MNCCDYVNKYDSLITRRSSCASESRFRTYDPHVCVIERAKLYGRAMNYDRSCACLSRRKQVVKQKLFVVVICCCWCMCLAKLADRFMNIAGDERIGKYLCPASESGRFLEMGYEKNLLLPPPPTESGRLLEIMEYSPPTELGRLLEITDYFCYYPPH